MTRNVDITCVFTKKKQTCFGLPKHVGFVLGFFCDPVFKEILFAQPSAKRQLTLDRPEATSSICESRLQGDRTDTGNAPRIRTKEPVTCPPSLTISGVGSSSLSAPRSWFWSQLLEGRWETRVWTQTSTSISCLVLSVSMCSPFRLCFKLSS